MSTADRPGPRYLSRDDVVRAARDIDPVDVVRAALLLHAQGRTTLPAEAYLPWGTSDGRSARSLALPGALWGDPPALGLKVINSSLANQGRGLRRAQGLTLLFDRETAHPVAIMEAAYLSALRTAAYTLLSVRLLAPPRPARIAVLGCGVIGETHGRMLGDALPGTRFVLYDLDGARQEALVTSLTSDGIDCAAAYAAEEAIRGAEVVITATTTTAGYLPHSWLQPGTLVAHVSLDDVLPDVVRLADLVIIDDWTLVGGDSRRLLGRMYRSGELLGPRGERHGVSSSGARRVDATLADVVAGRHPGRTTADQIILSNPFGMGILDVALAAQVFRVSSRLGIGTPLVT
jgi:ornithine cyclodeaminase/alanine dehydrogenase-like protein (mu-crystallin family)